MKSLKSYKKHLLSIFAFTAILFLFPKELAALTCDINNSESVCQGVTEGLGNCRVGNVYGKCIATSTIRTNGIQYGVCKCDLNNVDTGSNSGSNDDGDTKTVNTGLGLLSDIRIPLFDSPIGLDPSYYSVLSWITFIGTLAVIGIIAFWIVRILLSGVEAIRSNGDSGKLEESYKKVQANFIGIVISILFPVILSVVGFVLGIGSIFEWPRMFRDCPDASGIYEYYFQAFLREDNPDAVCGFEELQ